MHVRMYVRMFAVTLKWPRVYYQWQVVIITLSAVWHVERYIIWPTKQPTSQPHKQTHTQKAMAMATTTMTMTSTTVNMPPRY